MVLQAHLFAHVVVAEIKAYEIRIKGIHVNLAAKQIYGDKWKI
jgi:hypothetical protein